MLKVLLCLAAVFAASTNAYAGVTCIRYGNQVTCSDTSGGYASCWTNGNTTTCN